MSVTPTLKKYLSFVPYLFLRALFVLRSGKRIWYGIANRQAVKLFRSWSSPLRTSEQRIAADLRRDGIAISTMEELFPGEPHLTADLARYSESLRSHGAFSKTKAYSQQLFEEVSPLSDQNIFLPVILRPNIVRIVNAYMGLASRFYYFALGVTKPVGDGVPPVASQQWHRDPEDTRIVKIFIYLSDVDMPAGPFTYIKGSQLDGRYRAIAPQRPPRGSYPSAELIKETVSSSDIVSCIGTAGTVVFADTSGLHRGGYATTKERVMFTAGFYSPSCPWPILYTMPNGIPPAVAELALDPAVAYALSAPRPLFLEKMFHKFGRSFHV
ncbi:MAG: phytanoyl-CoA dioxygenase family protein [Patescibacteria group bacterium]